MLNTNKSSPSAQRSWSCWHMGRGEGQKYSNLSLLHSLALWQTQKPSGQSCLNQLWLEAVFRGWVLGKQPVRGIFVAPASPYWGILGLMAFAFWVLLPPCWTLWGGHVCNEGTRRACTHFHDHRHTASIQQGHPARVDSTESLSWQHWLIMISACFPNEFRLLCGSWLCGFSPLCLSPTPQ